MRVRLLVALLLLLSLPVPLAAHPDIDDQLAALTRREDGACDAGRELKIGDLYRSRRQWAQAAAAYERAATCDPALDHIDFARALLARDTGTPAAAARWLDRFLHRHPNAPQALLARARLRVQLGRPAEAVADFNRALAALPAAQPDDYLDRARAQHASGHTDEALRGLDEALRRLGPVPALQRLAIDLDVERRRYDAALARLDGVTAQAANRETWLLRRGEILELAGRPDAARAAYRAAQAAIAARPMHRRSAPAVRELDTRARLAADRLDAPPAEQE